MARSKKTAKRSSKKTPAAATVKVQQTSAPKGVIRFSRHVWSELWLRRRLFGALVLVAWLASLFVSGSTQHEQYLMLRDLTTTVTDVFGVSSSLLQSLSLSLSLMGGGLMASMSEGQQLWQLFVFVMIWLTVVWLLRRSFASEETPKLRDGLYSAGAPLVATLALLVIGLLQLLPLTIVMLGVATANSNGLLASVWGSLIALVFILPTLVLTLLWLTTTVFASVIVTIPGTYPIAALRSARSIVRGRRLKLVRYMVWLGFIVTLLVALVLLPVLLLDTLWQDSLPLVSSVFQLIVITGFVYASSYVYLLYRSMIDE